MTVPAKLAKNELERIGALQALDILDTDPEATFDHLALLAASICQAPITLMSFVDENRQWFKARVNLSETELPRDIAFCAHAILGDDIMVVEDASKDPRFAANPLVTGDPKISSYAGTLLVDKDGFKLGTICAIHTNEPVLLSDHQIEQMRLLGKVASDILVARQQSKIRVAEQKKKNEWLELSGQVAKLGYWTIDVETRDVFWSDEQYRLHGSSTETYEPDLESSIAFYHPDDRDYIRANIERTIATKAPCELEARMFLADGTEHIIHGKMICRLDELGNAVEVFGISQDITELRASEAALKDSEERFALAVLGSSVGIYDRQNLDSSDLYWSDQFYKLIGYEPGEIDPSLDTFLALLHPEDKVQFSVQRQRHLHTQEPLRIELRLKHKTQGYRWYLSTGQAVWGENGDARRISGSIMDINDLKQAQEAVQRSQRMEAVGQLTGGIAHDFNNLLAVIMGNMELLEETPNHPHRLEFIKSALRSAHRGAELTHQLLAFGRQTLLKPTRLNLNDIIAGMDDLLRRTIPESIEIEIVLKEGLEDFEIDPGQMENALLNLVINARDGMPQGGKLSIETTNITLTRPQTLSLDEKLETGQYVMVAITDTGVGIPANVLHKVFEPFFTTKKTGEGSGLGLSMVHGFVKQSGGTIRIYSEVGIGTTVILYFQAAKDADEVALDTLQAEKIASGHNERILVVEDEEDVRRIVVMQLQSLGYNVSEAKDGADAISILASEPPFDLLLSDIVMPGDLQGPDVALAARNINPHQKVIFMSGYPNQQAIDGKGLRADDVQLMKPVSRNDLAIALRKALQSGAEHSAT